MRIAAVTVRNFRSLKDVALNLGDYGAFIGANGAGKSSVLYALDWFFNDTPLTESDVHGCEEEGCGDGEQTIEVSVTFSDLTPEDRERLQQYGRGDIAVIRRTWYADGRPAKMVGNATQGPGFFAVRQASTASVRRAEYRALREQVPELPDLPGNASAGAITAALDAWEADAGNAEALVEILDADASQMMGWNGVNVLRECMRFVLVPAATSMAGEIGAASKGNALAEVIGTLMAEASTRARLAWLDKHAEAVNELAGDIQKGVEQATGAQANRINSRLTSLIPNASVTLTPTVPDFTPKLDPSISTAVTIAGVTNDVARQGHGVQRAVMIAMFQVMVPDADLTRSNHTQDDGEDDAAADERLQASLRRLPSIVVAVEEPEIYQHPVRARAFARTLCELSEQPRVQVFIATHSPYFIQPEQFASLHRFTYSRGETSVSTASVGSVSAASGIPAQTVAKAIARSVPTEFSEGFFADAVALVEGHTDRVVLEAVAPRLGKDLDRLGVTVLSVNGKEGLLVSRAILGALDIPTYVLADGDHGTAQRKSNKTQAQRDMAHDSHREQTRTLADALPKDSTSIIGAVPYAFGDPTAVCEHYTFWKDDIEEELGTWSAFVADLLTQKVVLAERNTKNLLAYRNAAVRADMTDAPDALKAAIAQIASLSCHDTSAQPADQA